MVKVVVKLLLISGLLIGLGYVWAEETPEAKAVVEVTANKLHLRTGLGTNFPPMHILKKGAKLVVVKEKLDWMEVQLPLDTPCWIAKKTVEIKEANQGIVKGHRVNVRFRSDLKSSSIIDQVSAGQELNIIGAEELWYKITPPENLTGWVSKKYVRYWGDVREYEKWLDEEAVRKDAADQLTTDLKELFLEAEEIYTTEKVKPILEQELSEALEIYRLIVSQSRDEPTIATAKERIKELEPRVEGLKHFRETTHKMIEEYRKANEEYQRQIEELLKPRPEKPYDATGLVDYVGKIYRRPGTHRLLKGGKTLFFLKSDTIDLDDFYNKQVGIWGKIVQHKGWLQKTIIVEDIKRLEEREIIRE